MYEYFILILPFYFSLLSRLLCLKYDLATRNGHHVLGVCVQFVNEKWEQEICHLAMKEVKGSATKAAIQRLIGEVLAEYEVAEENIYSASTDGAGNVIGCSANILTAFQSTLSPEETTFVEEQENLFQLEQIDDADDMDGLEDRMNASMSLNDSDLLDRTLTLSDTEEDTEVVCTPDPGPEAIEDIVNAASKAYYVKPTWCAAHLIQLAVRDFMKYRGRDRFLKKVKQQVKEARKYIRSLPADYAKPRLPIIPTDIRWSSQYMMVCICNDKYFCSIYIFVYTYFNLS